MPSSKIQILDESNFDAFVLQADRPVLVDFSAAWCGPCKVQTRILERLAEANGSVVVGMVDVDECPVLAARFAVRGMPTLLAFQNGRETARRLGVSTEPAVLALVAAVTSPLPATG